MRMRGRSFIPGMLLDGTVRAALMAHGKFGIWSSKTATSILRYSDTYDTVAILDESKAGHDASEYVGAIGKGIPVVTGLADALQYDPEVLIIGIAPVGGALPDAWRAEIAEALTHGLDVVSGLHTFLGDDPEFAKLAKEHGATITDVRKPTRPPRIASGEGRNVAGPVVVTVGTDCSSGKMTTTVEFVRAAKARGIDAGFAATGQTGIMIGCDAGAPIDRVVSDFVAGATEELVLECDRQGKELVVVEGQGATTHPAYSGVTVGILHGSFPDLVILCHEEGRTHKGEYAEGDHPFPTLPLNEEIDIIHKLLAPVSGGRVVAVSLATPHLDEAAAKAAIERVADETGLPTTDPVRYGADVLVDAVVEAAQDLGKKGVARLRKSVATKAN